MVNSEADNLESYISKFICRLNLMHATRHRAVKRLKAHKMHSKWTLALLAIAVIVVELQSQSEINFRFGDEYVNIISIVFSVMTLTYSLLLGMGDYSAKSVKMYHCAMALGKLRRESELLKIDSKSRNYNRDLKNIINKYNTILDGCDNHKDIDYMSERYKKCSDRKICMFLKIFWLFIMPFSHYYLSLILVYGWIILHSIFY